ncbi:MAG: HAD family hydrolase [Lachnospiraceae bacterium]|nr:HAD family hydrolase [Lachnospiraceae bacterium]MBO5144982.1 HAD family hydrolase [Lachnospiraceae bacterium]
MKNKEKVLYITDLDGTLLRRNERISAWSCSTINRLIEKGMLFSYATARSIYTASVVSEGLVPRLPVIVNNGSFITDSVSRKRILVNQFRDEEAQDIYKILRKHDIAPLVDAIIHDREKFSYDEHAINPALADFVSSRKNDGRDNPLNDTSVILQGTVFYFTCIGEADKLKAAYEELKPVYNCIFQYDIYTNEPWLEVMPHTASKSHAILQLKELYHCDKVVVFGDGINDIPMFEIADECYAMANAIEELKQIATAVIDSNENDGVAKWLNENKG